MPQINNPPIIKKSFTASMNYVDRVTDHDGSWIISNNNSYFKLGGTDTAVGDTQGATHGITDSGIARCTWFIVPFDMKVTNVTGVLQDDDMTTYVGAQNYAGIWKIRGFAAAGSDPGSNTGNQVFDLAYITDSAYLNNGYLWSWSWYDSGSPLFTLAAGDVVFAGTLVQRSWTGDASTLTMTIHGEES